MSPLYRATGTKKRLLDVKPQDPCLALPPAVWSDILASFLGLQEVIKCSLVSSSWASAARSDMVWCAWLADGVVSSQASPSGREKGMPLWTIFRDRPGSRCPRSLLVDTAGARHLLYQLSVNSCHSWSDLLAQAGIRTESEGVIHTSREWDAELALALLKTPLGLWSLLHCQPWVLAMIREMATQDIYQLLRVVAGSDHLLCQQILADMAAAGLSLRHVGVVLAYGGVEVVRGGMMRLADMAKLRPSQLAALLAHAENVSLVRDGVISVGQLQQVPDGDLSKVFSDGARSALRQGHITDLAQLTPLDGDLMPLLPSQGFQTAVQEKLLTVEDLAGLSQFHVAALLSDRGLSALRQGLFKPGDLRRLDASHLCALFSEAGLQGLRDGIIALNGDSLPSVDHIKAVLLHPLGMAAIREGVFSMEEVGQLPLWQVPEAFDEHCLSLLRDKVLTLRQVASLGRAHLESLLSPAGVRALRGRLVAVEEVASLERLHVYYLRARGGYDAIASGRTTLSQLRASNFAELKG